VDHGAVFRPLNSRKAVLKRTHVWQAGKNSETLLAFQKLLRRQGSHEPGIKIRYADETPLVAPLLITITLSVGTLEGRGDDFEKVAKMPVLNHALEQMSISAP
jgi:hypothetical protein